MRRTILAILIVLGVIVIDQLIKFDIKTTFMLHEDYVVARDWFHILFTENRGMAFGMQFVGTMFLALFRVVAIGLFCVLLSRLIQRKAPYGLIVCVQKRKGAVLFPHSCEALYHKPLHDAVTRVFGVGAYAGDKPHGILCAVDVHIQRIYRKLGNKVVLIKAAQHVCPLQHGEF